MVQNSPRKDVLLQAGVVLVGAGDFMSSSSWIFQPMAQIMDVLLRGNAWQEIHWPYEFESGFSREQCTNEDLVNGYVGTCT